MSPIFVIKGPMCFIDNILYQTFKGLAADVTAVRPAFLVLAGFVADEGAFLREALLTNIAAERTLTGVRPVVFVQTRWC